MSFILLVNILLSEEDFQALQKEPFRNGCANFVKFQYQFITLNYLEKNKQNN